MRFRTKEEAFNHLKTRFTSAPDVKKLMQTFDIPLKRGEYNSYEAALIDSVLKTFLAENQLAMRDLHAFFLEECPEFPVRELLVAMSAALECRSMNSVWIYLSYHYHPYVDARWEPENEIQLLNLVKVLGFKWKEICGIMNKSSRKCISNYYRIMGLRSISRQSFRLEGDIPTTADEWDSVCARLKTTRSRLSHLINGYISTKLVAPLWNEHNNMMLAAHVMFYNHFCSVKIDIPQLLEFLSSPADDEKPDRDRIRQEISRFVPSLETHCLDIRIELEDVFWRTIKVFMNFPSALLRARFMQIVKIHGIREFRHLLDVFRTMAVDCYLYRIKDRLREEVERIVGAKKA